VGVCIRNELRDGGWGGRGEEEGGGPLFVTHPAFVGNRSRSPDLSRIGCFPKQGRLHKTQSNQVPCTKQKNRKKKE